eukprot:359240-Chlamydomonas_euryale.AAC.21
MRPKAVIHSGARLACRPHASKGSEPPCDARHLVGAHGGEGADADRRAGGPPAPEDDVPAARPRRVRAHVQGAEADCAQLGGCSGGIRLRGGAAHHVFEETGAGHRRWMGARDCPACLPLSLSPYIIAA